MYTAAPGRNFHFVIFTECAFGQTAILNVCLCAEQIALKNKFFYVTVLFNMYYHFDALQILKLILWSSCSFNCHNGIFYVTQAYDCRFFSGHFEQWKLRYNLEFFIQIKFVFKGCCSIFETGGFNFFSVLLHYLKSWHRRIFWYFVYGNEIHEIIIILNLWPPGEVVDLADKISQARFLYVTDIACRLERIFFTLALILK